MDDVSIAYEGELAKNELELLQGRIPSVVHFHVKRYDAKELPNDDEGAGRWLLTLWDEKENRLKE